MFEDHAAAAELAKKIDGKVVYYYGVNGDAVASAEAVEAADRIVRVSRQYTENDFRPFVIADVSADNLGYLTGGNAERNEGTEWTENIEEADRFETGDAGVKLADKVGGILVRYDSRKKAISRLGDEE